MPTAWPQPASLGISRLEAILANRLERAGLPQPAREYRFAPPRRWRFDFAWPLPEWLVACEVEGGGWVGGRHVRGSGYARDLEKHAEALVRGWRVLRVDGRMIENGQAVEYLRRLLGDSAA